MWTLLADALRWLWQVSIAVMKWAWYHPVQAAIVGATLYVAGRWVEEQPWAGSQWVAGLLGYFGGVFFWTGVASLVGVAIGGTVGRFVAIVYAWMESSFAWLRTGAAALTVGPGSWLGTVGFGWMGFQ